MLQTAWTDTGYSFCLSVVCNCMWHTLDGKARNSFLCCPVTLPSDRLNCYQSDQCNGLACHAHPITGCMSPSIENALDGFSDGAARETGVSGPDHDHTISLTSLCGPKISGPDNNVVVWSWNFFRTRQRPPRTEQRPVIVWSKTKFCCFRTGQRPD